MRNFLKLLFRVGLKTAALAIFLALIGWILIARPVRPQNPTQLSTPPPDMSAALRRHVETLSIDIQNRNWKNPGQLDKAAEYVRSQWEEMGLTVEDQVFAVRDNTYRNLIVKLPGGGSSGKGKIIIGAHYDVAHDFPGADDNASGTAGLIELTRLLKDKTFSQDIELVAYTLEEPPNFGTENMGSFIHAQSEHEAGSKIDLMISIEMIGYYSDAPKSQSFPLKPLALYYPDKGNFIGVVDRLSSRRAAEVKKSMRGATDLPVHSINGPEALPGINFSDHLNYWHFEYDAVMITDTSFYRNTAYHTKDDTADRLNYDNMAKVVMAISHYVAGA